jgi:hypothetical protein
MASEISDMMDGRCWMEEGKCERSQAPDITQRLLAAKDGRGQIRIIPRSLLLIIPFIL